MVSNVTDCTCHTVTVHGILVFFVESGIMTDSVVVMVIFVASDGVS